MAARSLAHDKSAKVIANNNLERKTSVRKRAGLTEAKNTRADEKASATEDSKVPKIDYLAEMRKERIKNGKQAPERTIDSLMADKKLTEEERMEAVKNKAQSIEKQAHKKE